MTAATHFYRLAARAIAPILAVDGVRSVYVRRSVAAGDARFPWSDLDLAAVLEEPSGEALLRLLKRWRIAGALFPRVGECQVFAPGDLTALAETDPYRASLDRRFGYVVFGERPAIPERAIGERAAARRLVFWFQRYLPDVVRRGLLREQRKIALEMYNALGVLEGLWAEPLATRAETESRARAVGLLGGESLGEPFAACCRVAERAAQLVIEPPPAITSTVLLEGLAVIPRAESPWPDSAKGSATMVVTPAALQLLLEVQDPFLWLQHGEELARQGFASPSRLAWTEAASRTVRADQLRMPGFFGKQPRAMEPGIRRAERIIGALERGEPLGAIGREPEAMRYVSAAEYYRDEYEGLAARASDLYDRAARLQLIG